jgi:PAS domain S-box-containing protein
MLQRDCATHIALQEGRVVRGCEALMERRDGSRIYIAPNPTPLRDASGAVTGIVNMILDISERKKAELALAERDLQLALAGKAARVGSFAYGVSTELIQVSQGYAVIHGLGEGVTEIPRSKWRAGVHPDDIVRLDALRDRTWQEQRRESNVEYRVVHADGETRWIEARSFTSYDHHGRPQRVVGVNIDITERKRAEEHQRVLVAELDHRVKNVLATVSAIISRTQDSNPLVTDFATALDGRIRSMSSTHELLSQGRWRGIQLLELVERELAPFATSANSQIDGPEAVLAAEAAQIVAMVLHELVTNAAKYGALTTPTGRVRVRWGWQPNGASQGHLRLEWQEMGGPGVPPCNRSGYGTSVIRELLPYELGGKVDFRFAPEGVRCTLEIPAEWVGSGTFALLSARSQTDLLQRP